MSDACPRTELLSRSLDGELSAGEARELSRHVDGCVPCGRALLALGRVRREVGEARPHPPERLAPRVLGALRKEGLVGGRRSRYVTLGNHQLWTLAAGLVLAVGMTIWLGGEKFAIERLERAPAPAAPQPDAPTPSDPPVASNETSFAGGAAPAEVSEVPPATESQVAAADAGGPPAAKLQAAERARPNPAEPMAKRREVEAVGGRDASGETGAGAKQESDLRDDEPRAASAPAPAPASVPDDTRGVREDAAFAPVPPAPSVDAGAAAKEKDQDASFRQDAPTEPMRQKSLAGAVEGKSDEEAVSVVPARWAPEAGTVWDLPPRWTPQAARMIERVRGGRVVLRVAFSAAGKVTAIDVLGGDRNRGADLVRYLRALPQALHPAERAGVLVAGAGRVDVGSRRSGG